MGKKNPNNEEFDDHGAGSKMEGKCDYGDQTAEPLGSTVPQPNLAESDSEYSDKKIPLEALID